MWSVHAAPPAPAHPGASHALNLDQELRSHLGEEVAKENVKSSSRKLLNTPPLHMVLVEGEKGLPSMQPGWGSRPLHARPPPPAQERGGWMGAGGGHHGAGPPVRHPHHQGFRAGLSNESSPVSVRPYWAPCVLVLSGPPVVGGLQEHGKPGLAFMGLRSDGAREAGVAHPSHDRQAGAGKEKASALG